MSISRILRVLAVSVPCLAWQAPPAFAGGDELTEPDLGAVGRLAKGANPGMSYVAGLPVRRRECNEAAAPYLKSGLPESMAWGEEILIECYSTMLSKLAALYYRPDAFGPGGMRDLLKQLRRDLELLYRGTYQGRIHCVVECGPMDVVSALSAQRSVLERAAWTMGRMNVEYLDEDRWIEAWPPAVRE
jgi:hypothetical protein